ncbi:polysaccharide biosynthesis protein [Synechococcus sp. CS-1325]|nr:polysaccharide biosynthesis protein [Synechococcus sp. CS-1325]MCT0213718.1 polysaccharide biosynthesis protein [Synechococcus sp. CS-1326]MCT0234063.1 polysaccharide biosynthesis protein [Synechococcus sp. CS-1327]
MALDTFLISASFLATFYLRMQGDIMTYLIAYRELLAWAVLIGITVLASSGWYRSLTRYSGSLSLYGLLPRSGLFVLLLLLISTLQGGSQPPRSFWLIFWLLFSFSTITSRILLRDLLRLSLKGLLQKPGKPTIIYGVGNAALRLYEDLRNDQRFRLVAAIDDDPACWGRRIQNLPIHSPDNLGKLISRHGIEQVLLARTGDTKRGQRQIVDHLSGLGLNVLVMPTLRQLASGERLASDLRPIAIEDLLGREPSEADPKLLAAAIKGRCVLVTGAGGSIGTELCRQILRLKPTRLVLLERNEYSLYSIEQELKQNALQEKVSVPPVRAVLADSRKQGYLEKILLEQGVNVMFHAAAYKHVPLVEVNLCNGVENNIHSTQSALQAAINCQLDRFILISTDKAVRPTNAMGASKRVCELLVQAAAQEIAASGSGTICTMVRFGNVLGSSGSVIPLFRKQISRGGPITVTHPEMTRYFMTIQEAAQLVLQAAGMAKGGEVFLLDMGEPVKILNLARQMVQLSGLSVHNENGSQGDIEIHFTGLRPGEKLYEELLISAVDICTDNPLIYQARENSLKPEVLRKFMLEMDQAIDEMNPEWVKSLLQQMVDGYQDAPTNAFGPPAMATEDLGRTEMNTLNISRRLRSPFAPPSN